MVAPSNDSFANAIPFTTSVSGTNVDATLQSGESSSPLAIAGGRTLTTEYPFGSSVWYSYTAAATGFVNFRVNGGYDSAIQVYGSGGLSTLLTGNDDSSRGSDVSISVAANATYFLAVGGFFGNQGTFTLTATSVPSLFSINSASGTEGSAIEFVVTRSGDVSQAATVEYFTEDGSASSRSYDFEIAFVPISSDVEEPDYQYTSGTLTFEAGQRSQIVRVQTDVDQQAEGDEFFTLVLRRSNDSPGYDVSSALFQGVGTIRGTLSPTPTAGSNGTGSGGTYIPGAFYGTEGADTIIAQTPNAILVGNGGNDTYLVNSSTDQVIEVASGGSDIVYTTVSYNLGVNEVEALSTVQQTDTTAINLVGNFYSQIIVGNYGDNVLNGGSGGVDTLVGLFGNDTYAVGDARTVIVEQAGQGFDTAVTSVSYTLSAGVSVEVFAAQDASSTTGLRLGGNELAQTIAGTAGADTISGGGGRDVLLGGAGADTFVIGTVATGNVAVLADFVSGTDRIGLTSSAFNVDTTLDAAEFVAGTAATTADQRVIYDAGTGQLFYDADGNGAGAAVLFAQVVPGTAITAASFDVVLPTATTA